MLDSTSALLLFENGSALQLWLEQDLILDSLDRAGASKRFIELRILMVGAVLWVELLLPQLRLRVTHKLRFLQLLGKLVLIAIQQRVRIGERLVVGMTGILSAMPLLFRIGFVSIL